MLAFHEAFADIVALFQHFSLPEVLRHQIARTRGDLGGQNLLGELAQQFGEAIGSRGALRNAIGEIDPETGEWKPIEPDPTACSADGAARPRRDPRGGGLRRLPDDLQGAVADLLRIATEGTGVLPRGELHPTWSTAWPARRRAPRGTC